MAGSKRSILIEILGDSKGYAASTKGAETATAQLGKAIVKTYVAKQIIDFGKAAVSAASDMAESQSKVGVIFGDSADKIRDWSKTSSTAMGMSQRDALDSASTFATFGKAADLAGNNLVGFSTDLSELASDLASFHNTSPEDAVLAIGAALRGESEPIRRYGVLLNDATLKARAMELGIYNGTGALTAQQRVLAAQAEILAQTGDAQGDFARTSSGLANQARILAAQWEDMQAQLGQALLPVMLQVVSVVSTLFGWYNNLNSQQQTLIATVMLLAGALYVGLAAFNAVSVAVARMGLTMEAAMPWLLGIGAVIAGVTIALGFLGDGSVEAKKRADDFYKSVAIGIATIDRQRDSYNDATEAAKAYADAAYAEAEKKLRDSVLGNKELVAAMQQLGLTIDEVVASTRGGATADALLAKARAKLIDVTDTYAEENQRGNQISYQTWALLKNQRRAQDDLIGVIHNQTKAQYDSTQIAIERMKVGDAEAAQWLAATGQLDAVTASSRAQSVAWREMATASGDAATAQDDLGDATDDTTLSLQDQLKAIEELWDATRSSIDSDYAYRDAKRDTASAIIEYTSAVDKGKSSTEELTVLQEKAEKAALNQADAAVRLAEDQAKANGSTLDAEDKNRVFIAALKDAAYAMAPDSPMRKNLLALAQEFKDFPSDKNAVITVDVAVRGGGGGGGMKYMAGGGTIGSGDYAMVGETGQSEIVSRPTIVRGPAKVTGVRETAAMAGRAAGAFAPTIIVNDKPSAQELSRELIWGWRVGAGMVTNS